ncbi:uncharacterized protein LOC119628328 isoform X2 [Bombyx mori]|uniref:Ig-like domain-containing protein n=1 Tax=Bombyx mori TaxID=7091 RepID=A0A8R2LZB8_BOMMO|nr:uncharacterized protein LOC119628328 isoform X1 [Bombyx mori]XP_037870508.1 uncharacterized protein LOC119628328 isoform X1 [Bombyx mori]
MQMSRGNGRVLSILFSALLLGRAITVRGHTEVRVELQMERWAARGGSVRLRCVHDVPAHLLDKVVFLRHGTKIFQYIRDRKPPYRNFTTPGAVLNIALATENSIILQNLDFAASGSYSCEVSLDTPIYTKASSGKQLTVFHPQKHHPRIDFPTRYLSSGETLRANCTTAPALPAPHITWFINGKKMDGIVAHSHKFRVPMGERSGRRGLQRTFESNSTPPPLVALTHASHIATRPPGCNHKDNPVDEIGEIKERDETNMLHSTSSRHKIRKPSRRDLYVTISELQLVATGRLEITCVSTIPEFRSIDDKFADVRNDTVIVDVIKPSTYIQPTTNITIAEYNTSGAQRPYSVLYIMCICLLKIA